MPSSQGSEAAADLEADEAIRDWPENTEPTPQQLATWLYSCGERRRIAFAETALKNRSVAIDCFVRNHERMEDELRALRAEVQSMRLTMLEAVSLIGDEVTPEEAVAARLVKADLERHTLPVPIDL